MNKTREELLLEIAEIARAMGNNGVVEYGQCKQLNKLFKKLGLDLIEDID